MGIKERPFSESPAYYGKDRAFDKTDFSIPLYIPSYYDSQRFKRIKKASWLGSILVLFIYFGVFREPKDWDEMFNMDSRLIGVMQTKQMLKLRKEKLLLQGKSTHEVDAEMLDLIGQEAVIKAKLREEGKRKNLGKRRIPKQTKIEEKNQNSEGRGNDATDLTNM